MLQELTQTTKVQTFSIPSNHGMSRMLEISKILSVRIYITPRDSYFSFMPDML